MNTIVILLLILLSGAVLSYVAHKISAAVGNMFVAFFGLAAAIYFFANYQNIEPINFTISTLNLQWGANAYSNIFAMLVMVLSPLALIYSTSYMKEQQNQGAYYFSFFLSILGMMGIVLSNDFVSLFIFWEIMTWSSYLIVIYLGKEVETVGIKYMVFSAIGAYAMLMAVVIIHRELDTMLMSEVFENFATISSGKQLLIGLLLLFAFGVKSAVMPLHVWAPGAYANSPMSYTAIFSGALSKMGIWGIGLVVMKMFAGQEHTMVTNIFAWLGAITSVIATVYAILQDDAKKLLAYSSIGQLGYIVTGMAVGTPESIMAAIFLAILHGAFKSTLFMAVGAVERQAGSTDMTQVTGLIRKMPFTFIASLMSIIALAGIPPLGGFVGKWLLYESMITSDYYIVSILAFVASNAAFLYCFRFLFSIFLGQEEPEYNNVKEAPLSMVIPMMLMAAFLLVTGIFPGLLFEPIANGMAYMGIQVNWEMSLLVNAWGDKVNLVHVSGFIGGIFAVAALFISLKNRKNTRYVTTKDISTGGEVPEPHENLTYSQHFYQPFERAIEPMLKRTMDEIYDEFGKGFSALFQFIRYLYNGNGQTYAMYTVIFLVILLAFRNQIF